MVKIEVRPYFTPPKYFISSRMRAQRTMNGSRLLRDSFPAPVEGPGGYGIISFHHPHYPPRMSGLFVLPRVDRTRNPDRLFGVHHATALQACRIVAGNVSAGRLCLGRSGEEPVETGEDEIQILDQDSYYFVLADYREFLFSPSFSRPQKKIITETVLLTLLTAPHSRPYPIVLSFQDWTFPHRAIPDSWLLHGGNRRRPTTNAFSRSKASALGRPMSCPKGTEIGL